MSQFRQNPITKHWVLIAPNRAKRPEQFGNESASPANLPEIIPACVFCPGNESMNAEIGRFPNNDNWEVRVIQNKYEALSHTPLSMKKEFYVNRAGSGDHEVVITRKHNEPVAMQSIQTVELTLHVFKQRMLELAQHHHLSYVQIFHNHGRNAGASLVHPHHQIISMPFVPSIIHDEMLGTYHYHDIHKSCIYCDIVKEEKKLNERIVFETDEFIVFAPYFSRAPFETWIVPKKHAARFENISDKDITALAYVLKVTLGQLYVKLSDPSLNFYVHTMPFEHVQHSSYHEKAYHWHLTVFLRLMPPWGGFEWATGIPINPMPPEEAARFLR